jgi:hypothetical protein
MPIVAIIGVLIDAYKLLKPGNTSTAASDAYAALKPTITDLLGVAQQTGELTPDQHAQLIAHMDGEAERPEWLPQGPSK